MTFFDNSTLANPHKFPQPSLASCNDSTKSMALKAFLLLLASVAAIATPIAEPQNPTGLVQVNASLYCTGDISSTADFDDAVVQVGCVANVISNPPVATRNDSSGTYVLVLTPQPSVTIQSIITNCRISVTTPLSRCTAELAPAGVVPNLQFVIKTIPDGFSVIAYVSFIQDAHDCGPLVHQIIGARLVDQIIVWICLVYG
ncbi:hypothetical protein CDL12_23140 [Handroanthus impetiginosus]|uniref:Uncharacterized protein n=1 Tax=Handroanthus impetiginosus TaxID=429701 RepID=A0A2G9GGB9_9LAMI|nr:hypothetical protein CDL12_23140 [Handroanthus impetiginosus]